MNTQRKIQFGMVMLSMLAATLVMASEPVKVCSARKDMTEKQVLKLCGVPKRIYNTLPQYKNPEPLNMSHAEWEYGTGSETIYVGFAYGVVYYIL